MSRAILGTIQFKHGLFYNPKIDFLWVYVALCAGFLSSRLLVFVFYLVSQKPLICYQRLQPNLFVLTNLPVKLPIKSPFYGECLKFSVRKPSKPPILGLISDYYILFSL